MPILLAVWHGSDEYTGQSLYWHPLPAHDMLHSWSGTSGSSGCLFCAHSSAAALYVIALGGLPAMQPAGCEPIQRTHACWGSLLLGRQHCAAIVVVLPLNQTSDVSSSSPRRKHLTSSPVLPSITCEPASGMRSTAGGGDDGGEGQGS
eukprot:CAMPEP_0119398150 /NCGR_PEP_ID=MMETSP1334-20130426/140695_1 /TAXON_ID=127549 /ORGANISM="Calcidiscus leptoporus, Strain RCC1130" /LENGTH=147 /DNA_ID=CAMNT_0007422005 /DNA_START=1301 /DNA_END=1741 /DNA_ORIENTATION=-